MSNKLRKRDWAKRKLLSFVRVTLARKQLRALAYSRYRKQFDLNTASYYYLDILTQEELRIKPRSLGAYDIDLPAGWVVMADAEGDRYFYEPSLWKMSVAPPFGTVLCERCEGRSFASMRLLSTYGRLRNESLGSSGIDDEYEDNAVVPTAFCADCFAVRVEGLLNTEGVKPEDILFQKVEGNLTKSGIDDRSDHSWRGYLLGEKAFRRVRRAAEPRVSIISTVPEEEEEEAPIQCSACKLVDAERTCLQCRMDYCVACYDRRHDRVPWSLHSYEGVERMRF